MPIIYALVARKLSVLAEYTSTNGNFPTVTRVVLTKIPDQDGRMSYEYDKHVFHYMVDQGITFLCMADVDTKRRMAFAFLDDIKQLWRDKYAYVEATALAFSANEAFAPVLQQRMEYFSSNPAADNIAKVQQQIDTVKDVMLENIDRVLERGEKIELLVDKTDQLNQEAFKFKKTTKTLMNTMYYRKIRNICIIFTILALVVFFIVLMACGFTFERCK